MLVSLINRLSVLTVTGSTAVEATRSDGPESTRLLRSGHWTRGTSPAECAGRERTAPAAQARDRSESPGCRRRSERRGPADPFRTTRSPPRWTATLTQPRRESCNGSFPVAGTLKRRDAEWVVGLP